jgi:hypothetical protein
VAVTRSPKRKKPFLGSLAFSVIDAGPGGRLADASRKPSTSGLDPAVAKRFRIERIVSSAAGCGPARALSSSREASTA